MLMLMIMMKIIMMNARRSPALYTCGKYVTGHAAHPYFEGPRTHGWRERGLALTYGAI